MNRYAAGHNLLPLGAFLTPFWPVMLYPFFYHRSADGGSSLVLAALWLVSLLVSQALIAWHEAAHALVGSLVGIRPRAICIGFWRPLFSFPVRGVPVTVRAAPAGGYVVIDAVDAQVSGWKVSAFLLAGLVAEGVAVLVAYHWTFSIDASRFGDVALSFARVAIIGLGTFGILINALPFEANMGGEIWATDGLQLWRQWNLRHHAPTAEENELTGAWHEIRPLLEAKQHHAAREQLLALVQRHPDNDGLRNLLAHQHAECGDTRAAEAIWRQSLVRPGQSRLQLAETLDMLCCLPLYHDRRDLLPEADAWSTEALRHSPHAVTLQGTRGSILIELGRFDEGAALLRRVFKRSECPIDRAICSAYLAKVAAQQANPAEAERWLRQARTIDPEHRVVKRINVELAVTARA